MKKHLILIALLVGIIAAGFFVVYPQLSRTSNEEPGVTKLDETTQEPDKSITQVQEDDTQPETYQTEENTVAQQETPRSESVAASPKQTEIRTTTEVEKTYYPLAAPNDPGYTLVSWPMTMMNAPAAWDIAQGSTNSVIAVLDTGFALTHDDLSAQWYENTGETGTTNSSDTCWTGTPEDKSANDCDDDANGYIDDWRGWDFYNGTNNPAAGQDNPNGDGVSHGTETAGLAGAKGNNGVGIATLSWNSSLMPLKVLSDDGPGYTSDIAAAIYYAVDNGATVINMSLGGNEADSVLEAATDYAYANNVTVVAAAGNCGTGTGDACTGYPTGIIGYPARNPHVISVGAVDSSGARASFSSYGDALDVVAPGSGTMYAPTWTPEDETSLYRTSLYGTSYAAPYTASLVALLQSLDPALDADGITSIVLGTARKTGIADGVYSTTLGHGVVDAGRALLVANSIKTAGATTSLLDMTGNSKSEHTYTENTTMASGCETEAASAYCTVWITGGATGYDRILPYTLTTNNYTSWTWNTSLLPDSTISLNAVQANQLTAPYILSTK